MVTFFTWCQSAKGLEQILHFLQLGVQWNIVHLDIGRAAIGENGKLTTFYLAYAFHVAHGEELRN